MEFYVFSFDWIVFFFVFYANFIPFKVTMESQEAPEAQVKNTQL